MMKRKESLDWKPDWKAMSFQDKCRYILDYYRLHLALAAVFLYIIGYAGYRYTVRTNPVLYIDTVNVEGGEDLRELLTDRYLEQNAYGKRDRVILQDNLFLSEDPQNPLFQDTCVLHLKILSSAAADQLDLVLMDKEAFDAFSHSGFLQDLAVYSPRGGQDNDSAPDGTSADDTLPDDICSAFAENVIFPDTDEDESYGETEVSKMQSEPESSEELPAVTGFFGIDLSHTAYFGPGRFDRTVYLGMISGTGRTEEALRFIRYLWKQ